MTGSMYLGPDRSGIPWLLDPASPRLAEIGRALDARTDATPCDPDAIAEDLGALPALVRQQHFGIATGLISASTAAEAERLILATRDRVLVERPQTWGEALGDLNDDLRLCLHDRHIRLTGSKPTRIRADEPVGDVDQSAPAVEVHDEHGVLCVTIRRFWGGPEDDRRLWEFARDGAEHFRHDRIVVDLRGNTGGNDAIMAEWFLPALSEGVEIPGSSAGWYVADTPLGFWNSAAVIEAKDGRDAVPSFHLSHRHTPTPGDAVEVRADGDDEPTPAGASPWHGQLLVYVDGNTRSSGESSAWMLQHALGGRLIGRPTAGMLEYGNIVPYLLPAAGLHIALATKHNDFGVPMELIGFPVHLDVDPRTPLDEIAQRFDELHAAAKP